MCVGTPSPARTLSAHYVRVASRLPGTRVEASRISAREEWLAEPARRVWSRCGAPVVTRRSDTVGDAYTNSVQSRYWYFLTTTR
jgi:hypothetical protein